MKVILQQDVANLGKVGDVVNVADGYGRNFLIPRSLAVLADEGNVRRLEHQKQVTAHKRAKRTAEARALADRLSGLTVSIRRQAGEDNKLFGAVTNRDVAEALAQEGIEVDRRAIELDEPIRAVGVFMIPVRLDMGVRAEVKAYVIPA